MTTAGISHLMMVLNLYFPDPEKSRIRSRTIKFAAHRHKKSTEYKTCHAPWHSRPVDQNDNISAKENRLGLARGWNDVNV
jgi:hypothetical protein